MDAEDMVQETFLSLENISKESITNFKPFLCKVLTNRCIDFLKSARRKREVYVGPWLPEPLVFREDDEPIAQVINQDKLSIAYLTLMDTLSPPERAVFILREVLDFEYREVAEIVGKEEANCRKIFSRVKQKLDSECPEHKIDYQQHKQLLASFLQAIQTENAATLLELLSADAVLYSDGGGKVKAAIHPIQTRQRVIAFLLGVSKKIRSDSRVEFVRLNGEPGVGIYTGEVLLGAVGLKLRDRLIQSVYIIMNPDKLQRIPYQF